MHSESVDGRIVLMGSWDATLECLHQFLISCRVELQFIHELFTSSSRNVFGFTLRHDSSGKLIMMSQYLFGLDLLTSRAHNKE